MIPLGGYVRIRGLGVSSKLEGEEDPGRPVQGLGYDEVSHSKRAFISFAGPFANILTAFMIMLAVFQSVGRLDTTLSVTPTPGMPAYAAGLRENDTLISIDGHELRNWEEVGPLVDAARESGSKLRVTAQTPSGTLKNVEVSPVVQDGDTRIGVVSQTVRSSLPFPVAFQSAASATASIAKTTFASFGQLGHAFVSMPAQLAGQDDSTNRMVSPVGAARLAESSARNDGWLGPVTLIASISVFIALFNLLPLPPLDGSHIATAVYEGVMSRMRRKTVKVDPTFINRLASVTMAFVLMIGVGSLLLDILRPVVLP
jgi:membrane-associated protease RseP (regulator of RpoE activity)